MLTTHAGYIAVADNVRVFSVGRERGYGKIRRVLSFYTQLTRLLLSHRYDACFAHMQPIFAVMGAPLLALHGVQITTWYTHRQGSRTIDWAERVSYRIVTAVPSSFPITTPKLRPIGHGIDTDFFTPESSHPRAQPPRIVYVARLTAIKHQHILIEASTDLDCEVVLVGDIPDGYDDSYKQQLFARVDELGVRDKVRFAGAQTPQQVRDWYRSATVAINLSPPGLFDKAALEAMAVGVPTLVSNDAFATLTGDDAELLHIHAPDDASALTDRLQRLLALSEDERQSMGVRLRAGVVAEHSLAQLARKLICVLHTGELPRDEV